MGGALVVIGFLSQRVVTTVLTVFEDFGADIPMRVRVAASPLWVAAWVALAALSMCAAAALGGRRYGQAFVLASATSLLLLAAVVTLLAALALASAPCCLCGPIR
jgi:hypothetical protein